MTADQNPPSSRHQGAKDTLADLSDVRRRFAQQMIRILARKDDTPKVIGLRGEWGSGKTSVLNAIKNTIEKPQDNKDDIQLEGIQNLRVIEFNPWRYGDREKISEKFFEAIAKEIGETLNDSDVSAQVLEYFSEISPDGAKPVLKLAIKSPLTTEGLFFVGALAGLAYPFASFVIGHPWLHDSRFWCALAFSYIVLWLLKACVSSVSRVQAFLEKYISKRRKIYEFLVNECREYGLLKQAEQNLRDPIQEKLEGQDKKLIVMIDDIDRLRPDEIRDVFAHIRNHADFPNITYLVAYSHEPVARAHDIDLTARQKTDAAKDAESSESDGDAYIEKIINNVYDLPALSWEELEAELRSRVAEMVEGELTGDDKFRFDEFIDLQHAQKHLKTPRALHRLMDSMDVVYHSLSYATDTQNGARLNVNFGDLIGIETIRQQNPKLFSELPAKREILLTGRDHTSKEADSENETSKDETYNFIPLSWKSLAAWLFPRIDKSMPSLYRAPQKCRITDPAYFNLYFQYWFDPDLLLSEEEYQKFCTLTERAAIYQSLQALLSYDKKLTQLLRRLRSNSSWRQTPSCEHVIYVLLCLGDTVQLGEAQKEVFTDYIREFFVMQSENFSPLFERWLEETQSVGVLADVLYYFGRSRDFGHLVEKWEAVFLNKTPEQLMQNVFARAMLKVSEMNKHTNVFTDKFIPSLINKKDVQGLVWFLRRFVQDAPTPDDFPDALFKSVAKEHMEKCMYLVKSNLDQFTDVDIKRLAFIFSEKNSGSAILISSQAAKEYLQEMDVDKFLEWQYIGGAVN